MHVSYYPVQTHWGGTRCAQAAADSWFMVVHVASSGLRSLFSSCFLRFTNERVPWCNCWGWNESWQGSLRIWQLSRPWSYGSVEEQEIFEYLIFAVPAWPRTYAKIKFTWNKVFYSKFYANGNTEILQFCDWRLRFSVDFRMMEL